MMTDAIDTGALNLAWAEAIVDGLVAAGVADVAISPGARSTPFTLACLRQERLRCEVILDERSAAWFALGRARATGRASAVLCTSGTAAANWLPAVVEAERSAIPLLLLSTDRPPEAQGWGANQAIEQTHLFGVHVRAFHAPGAPFAGFDRRWLHQLAARAVAETRWPLPGPVHLNLPLREPLLPAESPPRRTSPDTTPGIAPAAIAADFPEMRPTAAAIAALAARLAGRQGFIVCGGGLPDGCADAVAKLAAALRCPILADPHSGLRFGPHPKRHVCSRHELWLKEAAPPRPDWVLRFGEAPVTRTLLTHIGACPEHYLVTPPGRWLDPAHRTARLIGGDPMAICEALCAAAPLPAPAAWQAAIDAAEAAVADLPVPPEGELLAALCRQLPSGTRFFIGNSMPVRDLCAWAGTGEAALSIHANRGASGIDGNIATAAGLAVSGPTLAVIGDLTAQHDLGSLALLRDKPLVLVVINNGGGGIFDYLPGRELPEFETGWLTPQSIDFAQAAAAFGVAHRRAAQPDAAVAAALSALAERRPTLVELTVDRLLSRRIRLRQ